MLGRSSAGVPLNQAELSAPLTSLRRAFEAEERRLVGSEQGRAFAASTRK